MTNIQLINADCIEHMKVMTDKSVDLILTDPPYEYENHGGGQAKLAQRQLVRDKHIDFMSAGFDYDQILTEFIRLCRIPNILMFCSNKQVSVLMSWFEQRHIPVDLLVWSKTNPIPLCNGKYLSDCEFIVYAHGKGAVFNNDCPYEYKRKVYSSPIVSNENRLHPAQKPVELLKRYILLHTMTGATVFDPFMGSGSTAIACADVNRRFIGVELDETYYGIAKQRIAAAEQGASPGVSKSTEKNKKLF